MGVTVGIVTLDVGKDADVGERKVTVDVTVGAVALGVCSGADKVGLSRSGVQPGGIVGRIGVVFANLDNSAASNLTVERIWLNVLASAELSACAAGCIANRKL